MAIYAISDLHLSFGTDKPMNIFGPKWENYTNKLKENWQAKVCPEDIVIIPGDISWAMYLEDAVEDFKFIDSLNGIKLIIKGNHDYWWTTMSKMDNFLKNNELNTIKILNNSAYMHDKIAICGTRGWCFAPENSTGEDRKIFEREKLRFILSLEDAKAHNPEKIIVALHYPPITEESREFLDIAREYNANICIYGHLHGSAHKTAIEGEKDGIKMRLVSCDYINFDPILLEI